MFNLPTESTDGWSGRDKSFSNPEKYERPEQLLEILDRLSKYPSVLVGGEVGTGKSTTLTALVKLLETNKLPYGTLSPKGAAVNSESDIGGSIIYYQDMAEQLEHYDGLSSVKPIIVIDSADYIHTPAYFYTDSKWKYFSYEELIARDPASLSLTEQDVLENYNSRLRFLRALGNGKFHVLGTFHTDWNSDNMEKTLYAEFKKLFPDDSVFKLKPLSPAY